MFHSKRLRGDNEGAPGSSYYVNADLNYLMAIPAKMFIRHSTRPIIPNMVDAFAILESGSFCAIKPIIIPTQLTAKPTGGKIQVISPMIETINAAFFIGIYPFICYYPKIPVERYLSPASGRRTTIVLPLFSLSIARSIAALSAPPEEIPASIPSFLPRSLVVS